MRDLRTAWQQTGSLPDVDMTRRQVELAQAKVEADRALRRSPDPLLVKIASAGGQQATGRVAG